VKLGLTALTLVALLSLAPCRAQQPSAVPDAPAPQPAPPLSGLSGPITPGSGSNETPETGSGSSSTAPDQPAPSSQAPSTTGKDTFQTAPPAIPAQGEGVDEVKSQLTINVNYVEVPVTVKDSKGKLVPGLTWRDFKVYENGARQQLKIFTTDSTPLAVAFVIDRSMTSDVMAKVNSSLGAIQGALTPYDEVAVFAYSHGSQEMTGFTGAQSARVPAVLEQTKSAGTEELGPVNSGPMANCSITKNGGCIDPNLQQGGSAGSGSFITIPKEIHTLNDAILAAAKELSSQPKPFRRIVYVISDGKENGSKATIREVLRYLETNEVAVYGTLVGTSATWGEGYVSRLHLPFTMYDNVLYKYTYATGGTLDSERNLNGIEKSYAKIAEEARNQYTLVYATKEPLIDGKYRHIVVNVERPGLEVVAKDGYYPNARDAH
jgi:VWFA-related protein